MKTVRRLFLVLLLLLVVAGAVVYFYLDSIIKRTVQVEATDSLNLKTTLDSVHVSLLGGQVTLNQLDVASPKGFAAPQMLGLGKLFVGVHYGELRKDPVRIDAISIEKPKFVLEQANGTWNFKALMDQQPAKAPPSTPPTNDKRPEGQAVRVIIGQLDVKDAEVVIMTGEFGAALGKNEINVTVPSVTLKNIGNADGAQNGVALKDVAMQVMTAVASKAGESAGLGDLKASLQANLQQVTAKLGEQVKGQVNDLTKQVTDKLPGDAGKALENVGGGGVAPDLNKKVDDATGNLGGLIGGDKKDKDKKKPK